MILAIAPAPPNALFLPDMQQDSLDRATVRSNLTAFASIGIAIACRPQFADNSARGMQGQ
jgi:hypothetical protein